MCFFTVRYLVNACLLRQSYCFFFFFFFYVANWWCDYESALVVSIVADTHKQLQILCVLKKYINVLLRFMLTDNVDSLLMQPANQQPA